MKTHFNKPKQSYGHTPVIFDFRKKSDQQKFNSLVKTGKIINIIDNFEGQLLELYGLNNPAQYYSKNFDYKFTQYLKQLKSRLDINKLGRWIYFPWLFTGTHILGEADFFKVRTARNKNLINEAEQKKFYNSVIGIAGLSVGNSVALAIALQGGAKYIKLADPDILELSNTNRIRCGINNLGLPKVIITARQIYEINPYAKIELYTSGLTEKNIDKFFNKTQALDIIVDEIDNLAIKYLIREKAKKYRIPVLMAADNGDGGIIDIERYDLNPKTPFFHNRMGKVTYKKLKNLDKFGIGKLITKHVGKNNIPKRMDESLSEMGKTIISWPQLGGAAMLNGPAVAYCVRKILNNQPLNSNRGIISLDNQLK